MPFKPAKAKNSMFVLVANYQVDLWVGENVSSESMAEGRNVVEEMMLEKSRSSLGSRLDERDMNILGGNTGQVYFGESLRVYRQGYERACFRVKFPPKVAIWKQPQDHNRASAAGSRGLVWNLSRCRVAAPTRSSVSSSAASHSALV